MVSRFSRAACFLGAFGLTQCTGYFHEESLRGSTLLRFAQIELLSDSPTSSATLRVRALGVEGQPTHWCALEASTPRVEDCEWQSHDFNGSSEFMVQLAHDRAGWRRVWVALGRAPFGAAQVSAFKNVLVEMYEGQSRLLSTTLPEPTFAHSTLLLPRDGTLLLIGGTAGGSSYTRTLRLTPSYSQGGRVVDFSLSAGPSLSEGRNSFGSTVTPGGKVLVYRGHGGGSTYLTSLEVLEGALQNAWTLVPGSFSGATNAAVYADYTWGGDTAITAVSGTTLRYINWVTHSASTPSGGYQPPVSLERGSLNRIRKGSLAGRLVHLGGIGNERVNAHVLNLNSPGSWTTATGVVPDGGRFDHQAVELRDGRILLVAGRAWNGTSVDATQLVVFDPPESGPIVAGNFRLVPVGHPLSAPTVTLLPDDRVLILGGDVTGSSYPGFGSRTAYFFDPRTNELHRAAPLARSRSAHSATLLPNGQVLLAGGIDEFSQPSTTLEVYDPEYGIQYKFRKVGDLPSSRAGMRGLRLGDGRVSFGGGLAGTVGSFDLFTFDPKTETLSTVAGSLPIEVLQAQLVQPLSSLFGDHLFWLGRDRLGGEVTSWSPSLGTFGSSSPAPPDIPELRETFNFLPVSNGSWVLLGGSDGPVRTRCWDKAKIYRSHLNTWTESSNSMGTARCAAEAQVVPDGLAYGKILVTGGKTFAESNLSSTEIYPPGANMFFTVGLQNLATARHIHGQITLFDGRSFVYGGNVGGSFLSSSELSNGFRTSSTFASFVPGPQLVSGMAYPRHVLLPNGEYLVIGLTASQTGRCQIFNPFDLAFRDCSAQLPDEYRGNGIFFSTLESTARGALLTGGRDAGGAQVRGVYLFE